MNRLIKNLTLTVFFLLAVQPLYSTDKAFSAREILTINSLSRYIDSKPQSLGLKYLKSALKSNNSSIRGLAALIYFKYSGKGSYGLLKRNFTLNTEVSGYSKNKRSLVSLNKYDELKQLIEKDIIRIKDERVKAVARFFIFKTKNISLVGHSGEKLSLAKFHRIAALAKVLGQNFACIELANKLDKKNNLK
jgi:hypothetical protein